MDFVWIKLNHIQRLSIHSQHYFCFIHIQRANGTLFQVLFELTNVNLIKHNFAIISFTLSTTSISISQLSLAPMSTSLKSISQLSVVIPHGHFHSWNDQHHQFPCRELLFTLPDFKWLQEHESSNNIKEQ